MKMQLISKRNNTLVFILVLLIAFNLFIWSVQFLFKEGSGDLRNRVVGARVFLENHDPYFFHWQPGMPEEWLDTRVDPSASISRLTTTPSVLLFHLPFARLTFKTQIIFWYILQWLALFSIIALFLGIAKSTENKKRLLFVGVLFAASSFWYTHLSVGQVYIYYSFLLSLAIVCIVKLPEQWKYIGYFIIGVTAGLRLPYILFVPVLFIFSKRKSSLIVLLGFIFTVFISAESMNWSIWKSYLSSMSHYANNKILAGVRINFTNDGSYFPLTIEGLQIFNKFKGYFEGESSVKGIVQRLSGIQISPFVLYLLFAVFSFWYFRKILYIKKTRPDVRKIFLACTLFAIASEFFLPSARYIYYDVQFIVPLMLFVLIRKSIPVLEYIAIILSPFFFFIFPSLDPILTYILIWGSIRSLIRRD